MTESRVRIRDVYETSRGVDERLCSESGAKLDNQAGDKRCIERVNYERNTLRLTWRQEIKTEVSR